MTISDNTDDQTALSLTILTAGVYDELDSSPTFLGDETGRGHTQTQTITWS